MYSTMEQLLRKVTPVCLPSRKNEVWHSWELQTSLRYIWYHCVLRCADTVKTWQYIEVCDFQGISLLKTLISLNEERKEQVQNIKVYSQDYMTKIPNDSMTHGINCNIDLNFSFKLSTVKAPDSQICHLHFQTVCTVSRPIRKDWTNHKRLGSLSPISPVFHLLLG